MTVQGAKGIVVPQQVYQGPSTTATDLGPNITFVQHNTAGVLMDTAYHPAFRRGDIHSTGMTDGTAEANIRHNNQMITIRILVRCAVDFSRNLLT